MSIGIWQQVVCKCCKWNLSIGIKARLVVVVPYLSSMVFSFGSLGVSSIDMLLRVLFLKSLFVSASLSILHSIGVKF